MENERTLRVMAVGGGNQDRDSSWTRAWRTALTTGIRRWDPELAIEFEFIACEDLFALRAVVDEPFMERLWTILGADWPKWLRRHRLSARQLEHVRDELHRVAESVVAWMSDEHARLRARTLLHERLLAFQPDVLVAHGVGSLIAYDAISRRPAPEPWPLIFVAFGSQIGNPRVQGQCFCGRAARLPVRHWYHLYNHQDDAFTAPIRLDSGNFTEIDAPFRTLDRDHWTAAAYLSHAAMSERIWRVLLEPAHLARCLRNFRGCA